MKAFLAKLLASVLGVSKSLAALFIPILTGAVATSLETLLPAALVIVTELARNNQLGNAEKRASALTNLQQIAVDSGIKCGVSVLNTAIEVALQNLKAGVK